MNPMNPEWKARWLKALRSGEYKQGTGLLRRDDETFCCLGVLCDLVSKENATIHVGKQVVLLSDDTRTYYTYDFCGGGLPNTVTKITGVQAAGQFGPQYDKNRKYPSPYLANLNDMGWSFERISDVIEKEL